MNPSFSIFKPNSSEKVDTLQHCFMKDQQFKRNDLPSQILAPDGLVYEAVYEDRIPLSMFFDGIISFQQHTYGRFAIVRVKRDKKHA